MNLPDADFFLYAHPDFTSRNDFTSVLTPLITANIPHNQDLEFDIQPEKLNITVGNNKVGEKVVMLRSTTRHNEQIQTFLTNLFDTDNETNIETIRKYVFVPMNFSGDESRIIMQGILRTQQNFRKTVYHYIVTNVKNLCTAYAITTTPMQDQMDTANQMETETPQPDEQDSTEQQQLKDTNIQTQQDTQKTQQPPAPTEMYTLREWFYDLMDEDNEPLLHSVYPSADTNKIFVLCEKAKAIKVLELLHNLQEAASHDFPQTAIEAIFGNNGELPLVHNHPRATSQLSKYAARLATHALAQNPQEEQLTTAQQQEENRKRNRKGDPVQTTYANAVANTQSQPFQYGANITDLLNKLQQNQQNLTQVEQQQQVQAQTLQNYDQRFKNIEAGLEGHGKVLTQLSETQTQQGTVLTNLQTKMSNLVDYLTKPAQLHQDHNQQPPQATMSPNPSHGVLEGTPP